MGLMKDFDIRIRNGGDDAAGAVNELMAELQRRLLELQASMPRWISVTERLPDDETELLVAFEDRSLGVAFAVFHHLDENERPKWTDGNGVELKEPSHWMPLPAPPTDAK